MNSTRLALVLLAAVCGASGCVTLEPSQVAAPPGGGKVVLRTGSPLVVSLPPDPSTGTGWVLRKSGENLAQIGGPDYTPEPKPPALTGVASTTAFRFRAVRSGNSELEFAWVAPPGAAAAPERVVRYQVSVDPPWFIENVSSYAGGAASGYWK